MSKVLFLKVLSLLVAVVISTHILFVVLYDLYIVEEGAYEHKVGGVGFDTVQPPVRIDGGAPANIKSLTSLLLAISEYENDNFQFPISSNHGRGWSSPTNSDQNWITGIAPKYIESLPEDKRKSKKVNHNFLYRSNGIDFKLIAHRPGDCEEVKKIYPNLIDVKRNCYAYGYWTLGAKYW